MKIKFPTGKKSKRAFTLVELLITIAIVAVVGVIGFINLINYRNVQSLDLSTQEALNAIRYTQQQSINQDSGSQWGISFSKGAAGNPDYFAIYRGTSSQYGVVTATTTLPTNIYLGSSIDVPLNKLTGLPNTRSTITLYLPGNPPLVREIVVDTFGVISSQNPTSTTFGNNWQSFGSFGSGVNQFNALTGISVDSANNKVYVADNVNYRIVRFDSGSGGTTFGGNWQSFGSGGSGVNQFNLPMAISVDSANNKVYVADTSNINNNRIVSFDSGSGGTTFGNNWQSFGSGGSGVNQFKTSAGISVDSTNNKVYVADTNNNRVDLFDSGSGGTTFGNNWQSFGSLGSGTNQFHLPEGISVDPINNKVYVIDTSNNRILSFDSGSGGTTFGNNWQSFGSLGSGTNQVIYPWGVFVDPTNNKVYVADTNNNRVDLFDSGSGGTTFGGNWQSFGSAGSGVNQFKALAGISVDSVNSKVYVADELNNRVDRFDSWSP